MVCSRCLIMGYKPRIRFKGFTEDWEQREFSDIFAEVKSGLSRMLSNDDIGLPVVRANNINDGQLNLFDDIKYWYKNDPQGANTNNYLIEQGDILINFINSEAKMGTAAYVTRRPERDTIYTTNILRCKVNDEYNPYFIYSLTFLNSYKNYIASITKPAVNQASFTTVDFKKYSIKIPTVKEQNQIANLIEIFNKFITLHQCKLEKLKLTKKALLQKLFPKNGKHIPEIRFKGFTDAWEQRKLIYIFNDFIVPMRDKPKIFSGTTPWTRIEDIEGRYINTSLSGQFVSDETIKSMNLKVIPKGSLIVSASATFGVVAIVNNDLITNQTFIGLVPNNDFDIDFLYSLFEAPTTKDKLLKLSAGSTIFYIARESFENLVLSVPSKAEQIKISKIFKFIDNSITLHQRKLERLQEVKKGLLQKMFV